LEQFKIGREQQLNACMAADDSVNYSAFVSTGEASMPQILESVKYTHEPAPNPVRWTRQQCRAMLENGLLAGRYELIEGEIINKMGQKRSHALAIICLTAWLIELFGSQFVQFQLPIEVPQPDNDTSEPEPDAAVLDCPATDFVDATPPASHVQLVVEVSDTTLGYDRNTKAALYARAGIAEYWIVDIGGRQLLVHRTPADGAYAALIAYNAQEAVACLARPDAPVLVADLLPPI
jgi:Uma2 family endonuclease